MPDTRDPKTIIKELEYENDGLRDEISVLKEQLELFDQFKEILKQLMKESL